MDVEQPKLVPVPHKDLYRLHEGYRYSYNNGEIIYVPEGFEFDGASIPEFAQHFLYTPFHPKVMLAAMVHDYLYTTGEVDRMTADSIFYTLLRDSGVPYLIAETMYAGVRTGGRSHYKEK